MTFPVTAGAVLGLQPGSETCRVVNRTGGAVVVGQLVMFDLSQTDAAVTNGTIGDSASGLANVISPATAGLKVGWYGVVTAGGAGAADDAETEVYVRGRISALVQGTDATAVTDVLSAVNGQGSLDSDAPVTGAKILGRPMEVSSGASAELISIVFDGITGFGHES